MTYQVRYLVANSNQLALINGLVCLMGQTKQHHYPPLFIYFFPRFGWPINVEAVLGDIFRFAATQKCERQ